MTPKPTPARTTIGAAFAEQEAEAISFLHRGLPVDQVAGLLEVDRAFVENVRTNPQAGRYYVWRYRSWAVCKIDSPTFLPTGSEIETAAAALREARTGRKRRSNYRSRRNAIEWLSNHLTETADMPFPGTEQADAARRSAAG